MPPKKATTRGKGKGKQVVKPVVRKPPPKIDLGLGEINAKTITDEKLKALLRKEIDVTKKIDTLMKELEVLDDLGNVGSENARIIPEPKKKGVNTVLNYFSRMNTDKEEEEEEDDDDDDLEEYVDSSDDEEKKERERKRREAIEEAESQIDLKDYEAPDWCIPIKANVLTFDWDELANECQFDVIVADPPWQLATSAPTRGVAISYQQLPDVCIESVPIEKLQTNGFIFLWVINNKYAKAFELLERWGYTYVDDITWVKRTVNRRMAKGHGYYLQHAKESCLVGKKGDDPPGTRRSIASDVIYSERRGQSQKPEELYELIEELVPDGKYIEIFGRKNNLRDYWVTIGNEL
ncbi:unnamed protein product [Cunninghamella blakesleeana]